jgi:hypothetical protein
MMSTFFATSSQREVIKKFIEIYLGVEYEALLVARDLFDSGLPSLVTQKA